MRRDQDCPRGDLSTAPVPLVLADDRRVTRLAAELVANRLLARPALRLILPTGHTPLGMYAVLRELAAAGALDASGATLFQLDEYLGLEQSDPRSYRAYLRRELGGMRFGAFHRLDGAADDPARECERHERLLAEAPVDLAVLGLGRDGHVAFDEPGSPLLAGTRRVRLHETTRSDAAREFGGIERVPAEALTVGLRTLLDARELLMLVTGAAKAEALRAMLRNEPGSACPASLLRGHPRLTILADPAAARLLEAAPGSRSDRVVIVLGHREPGVSSDMRVSDESLERLRRAERVCRARSPRAVLFTGYTRTPAGMSEAEHLEAAWPATGIPTLMEQAGRNTAENASRSLPLVEAIGGIDAVTVVTSGWHVRAPWFFRPYRAAGLRVSFRFDWSGPWLRMLPAELRGLGRMRAQRDAAFGPPSRSRATPSRQPTSETAIAK